MTTSQPRASIPGNQGMFDVVDPSGGGGQGRRAGEERRDKWRW